MTQLKDLPRPAVLAFVFAFALVTASCASAPRSASRAEVEVVVNGLVAAVNSADVEGFMAFFASDASVFLPSAANPSRLTGHAQIRAGISPALAARPTNPMAIRDLLITVEGTMAVASF
jgi:ketosteroid isomerase-like protein